MTTKTLSTRNGITAKSLLRNNAYIGGTWCAAASGDRFNVTDPATGKRIGDVASLSGAEATLAVDAAQCAFPGWSGLLPQQRSAILRRWFTLILDHKEALARIMVTETGQTDLGSTGRDRLCRVLCRVLRRRGQAPQYRMASPAPCPMPRSSSGWSPSALSR